MKTNIGTLERLIDSGICPAKSSKQYAIELKELGQQLEREIQKELVHFFKAISDLRRLKIIKLLLIRKMCVCELTEALKVSQSTVSHHLKTLENAGLILGFVKGKWTFYKLKNPDRLLKLLKDAEEVIPRSHKTS